jgi:predicted nucleotidyltransferase
MTANDHSELQLPKAWLNTLRHWAARHPQIESVYVYGSRAKGCAHVDSDLDVAYRIKEGGPESPLTVAMYNGDGWLAELEAVLPVDVHLQFADEDDIIVWPAVLDHGICVYGPRSLNE